MSETIDNDVPAELVNKPHKVISAVEYARLIETDSIDQDVYYFVCGDVPVDL